MRWLRRDIHKTYTEAINQDIINESNHTREIYIIYKNHKSLYARMYRGDNNYFYKMYWRARERAQKLEGI